jgi:transcriptional regulator with XRE-family HTH domain
MNLGKAIKQIRGKAFTQQEIAYLTDVTNVYVSLVENNKKEPSIKWLRRFSLAVNVAVPVIFYVALDDDDATYGMENEYHLLKPLIDSNMAKCFAGTNIDTEIKEDV